jgi:hypothetical protein
MPDGACTNPFPSENSPFAPLAIFLPHPGTENTFKTLLNPPKRLQATARFSYLTYARKATIIE